MKNLVVKTAIITLIVVFSVTVVTFALLTAFAPGVMLKVTSGLGMDKSALSFAVRYYEKTEDISDLMPYELFELIGRKRGFLISGGEIDYARCAAMLLDEFRDGTIGRITLEHPTEE